MTSMPSPFRRAALPALLATAFASQAALAQTPPVTALKEVTVIGASEAGYAARTSSTATKTDTLLRDTPQAVTVITRELMDDQAMQSMADAIRYVPGIVSVQGEGNRDAAVLRGSSSTSDFYVDGIRDDVQYYRDFYNIDAVEALKGSNAMIFGRGGSGGVINRVTKQPQWSPLREATLTLGMHANRRAAVDIGQAASADVAVRINAMVEDSGSFRQGMQVERAGINPTLGIRAGKDTSIVLGVEHFRDDRVADRGVPSFNGKPFDTDPSVFFGNADLSPTYVRVNAFTAALEHSFGNGLVLRNRTRLADYEKSYQNVFANSAVSASTGRLAVNAYRDATERRNLFNQTDLNATIQAGALRHTLAAGVELGRQDNDSTRRNGIFDTATPTVAASAPRYNGAVSFAAITNQSHSEATVASVYLQDQLEFSPQWQAVLGLRRDRFALDFHNLVARTAVAVTDTPVSPRAGLIYKPVTAMSLYASYSRAYAPRAGEQLTSLTPTNSAFDPEQFNNAELGFKWDVSPDLSATAAAYRLDRSNVIVPGPVSGTSILVDGQVTRGLELGLSGKLARGWSVMGGYAWQHARLTADQSATVRAGATVAMVPTHVFSLWNRVDVNAQWAAALGLSYRDSLYTSTTNTVSLPSYVRVDGALYYALGKQLKLQLNVENLFDTKYYVSANSDNNISPGSPRTARLTLTAKF